MSNKMKTASDLFQYVRSKCEAGEFAFQFGGIYISVYNSYTKNEKLIFSVGLDNNAEDINFISRFPKGEFHYFNVYPKESGKPECQSVPWKADETFSELIEKCPNGRNINIIADALERMIGEREGSL